MFMMMDLTFFSYRKRERVNTLISPPLSSSSPSGRIWCHPVIQAVFFGLCVLIDVSSLLTKGGDSREQERQLRKLIGLRDWMMAVLAFPVGAFVVFTFWSLYLYDRDLVYPRLLDNFIPQWLNHGMHTTVLPSSLRCEPTHHSDAAALVMGVGVPALEPHHRWLESSLQCDDGGDQKQCAASDRSPLLKVPHWTNDAGVGLTTQDSV
ncbi:androgen-induced gene 1 protein isoform X1 [Lates japonicus]|uniref:Androgen-induced gene 1 protein isoform X1 n=1 Tax=Lates japonicus TaxID=270547 RepID=A0AAD3RLU9_LATJO|nr:androgen-induced gene 1 protein isoform X1 [Lates japonicus]